MPSILTQAPLLEPVSLTEVKAHLRLTHDDEDQYLNILTKAARQAIETQTGLLLIEQGWSLYLDDWPPSSVVDLKHSPLLEVSDVIISSTDDVTATIDPSHYYVDKIATNPRLILRGSRSWARPEKIANAIEIKILVGFGAIPDSVPAPLREAILQLIAHFYALRGDANECEMPLLVKQLLQPFRRVRL